MIHKHAVVAGIAAMAIAGCSHTSKEQTHVTSAQTQADRALDEAHQKQHAALDQQRKAEQAEADVRQKEKDLAEAQTRAQDERRKAEQMQRDAQAATEKAAGKAQTSQEEAEEAQREQRAQQAAPQTVSGTLVGASEDRITIDHDGEQLELSVGPAAQIMLDGQEANAGELPIGSEVRAAYIPGQPIPQAQRIDVTSEGAAPAQPENPSEEYPSSPEME